jgi:DNA-binding MarR family transcriptional regulator
MIAQSVCMSDHVSTDELFARMFEVHHRVLVDLERVAAFEEWSPFEVLAMRVFSLTAHAIGAIDIARALGCSFPYASRLSKKLQARGFIAEHRWHQWRSLQRTLPGEEWIESELPYLLAFTDAVFGDLTPPERTQLYELLGRVRRSVSE